MTEFLDLLEAYHHWCVSGNRTRLERCREWLAADIPVPTNEMEWHRLGTQAINWLVPLPAGWEPNWHMLSPREMTLTVDALDYLETRRPGAIAGAFSQEDAPPVPVSPLLQDVPSNWSLSDVLACVEREVARREADYPREVQQGRLPADRARQEVGQMKAAAIILKAMADKGLDSRQETLF